MKYILSLVFLLALVAANCGRATDNKDKEKTADPSALSADDPSQFSAGQPPVFISYTTNTNTSLSVVLSKECTDATISSLANYVFSNGLTVSAATKNAANKFQIDLTTSAQTNINYTLTIFNLTSTEGVAINGVIQILFTGLQAPVATVTWYDPQNTSNALPIVIPNGAIQSNLNTIYPNYIRSALYGTVGGTAIVAYKTKLDAGSWSAEIPSGTPINITGLADGFHTFYVIGKHSAGYWQDTAVATTVSWIQDTTPPAAAEIDPLTKPVADGGVTASQSLSLRIIGTDVAYYKYCIDNGAYNDCTLGNYVGGPDPVTSDLVIPKATPAYPSAYNALLTPGSVTLKVIGFDASGNQQTSAATTAGTYTFTVNTGLVEAVYNTGTLPNSINNGATSANVDVLGTYGATHYKGAIVDGTTCPTLLATWDGYTMQPISTPITRSGMTDATPKTVCAIGYNNITGVWQGSYNPGVAAPSYSTKYTWIIDTTAPTASVFWKSPITAPTSTTQSTGYQLQVTASGATNYRYAVVASATACSAAPYSSNQSIDLDLAFGSPDIATSGTNAYKVCVIAGDAAGNWQAAGSATIAGPWTVDFDPPATNPTFAAVSLATQSFNISQITFSIDNVGATADSRYYRIQIATDAGFTNIVDDSFFKSCKTVDLPECTGALGTRTYSIAVNTNNSPSYYARVRAGDTLGNYRSDWSGASAEHFVRGQITGRIENSAGVGVNGVTVRILDSDGSSLAALYPDQVTANQAAQPGFFTFTNVRASKGRYQILAAPSDATYREGVKRNITVQEEGTAGTIKTNIGSINLILDATVTTQNVTTKVVDADDGWMLGYADVKLIKWDGTTVATGRTNYLAANCTSVTPISDPPTNIPKQKFDLGGTCGDITFAGVEPGTYTIQVSGTSWGTNQSYNNLNVENIAVNTGAYNAGRIPIVKTLTGQDLKMVLSWGTNRPIDLDLHMVGTLPSGQTVTNVNSDNCNSTMFHIWAARPNVGLSWAQQYSSKTRTYIQGNAAYNAQNYFPLDPSTTSALVQDANTGYGPEAINMISGYTDGTYWVSVVNWGEWKPGSYGTTKAAEQWDISSANIKVYDADGLAFEMNVAQPTAVPSNPFGADGTCDAINEWAQCELWQGFRMTVAGSGSAGRTFTPVGTFAGWPDGSGNYDESKCNLQGF